MTVAAFVADVSVLPPSTLQLLLKSELINRRGNSNDSKGRTAKVVNCN